MVNRDSTKVKRVMANVRKWCPMSAEDGNGLGWREKLEADWLAAAGRFVVLILSK
jgi:hypothetical protein